ncbi:MAG TPA: hypothetical protein VJG32_22275 [Anaerolineae bacterium]|nr:hypothetical protein [Anaerolineae bacterium]
MASRFAKHAPLLALGVLALLAGMWAGLIRIGWDWPPLQLRLPSAHGPLMISGFLGTLISLERAVALAAPANGGRRRWTYTAPLVTALGGTALLLGLPDPIGRGLITLGSLALVAVLGLIIRLRTTWDTVVMGLGAALWLIGNALWWSGQPTYQVTPWWIGFLVLTIAGERLELARVLLLRRNAQLMFLGSVGVFLAGLLASVVSFNLGVRIGGVGLAALGLWLFQHDSARRTIRHSGLTRFIAACLLPGYLWLIFAGGIWIAGNFSGGQTYDAAVHSVLLGFVFSMIFGHAPSILPAVLNAPVTFRPIYYAHLALLHASLALRLIGDFAPEPSLRALGGLLNVAAILLFMGNTLRALRVSAVPLAQ